MKKIILCLVSMIKSLFCCKKCAQKRVLEKIDIVKPMKKKRGPAGKKSKGKKKCQK